MSYISFNYFNPSKAEMPLIRRGVQGNQNVKKTEFREDLRKVKNMN